MIDGEDAILEFKESFDEEVMNGHFYSYNRLEDFLFDLDPTEKLLHQKNHKAIPVDTGIKVTLNETGEKILKTDPELKPGQSLFGYKYEEFKFLKLPDVIEVGEPKVTFKKIIKGEALLANEEKIFSIRRGGFDYVFRVEHQEVKALASKDTVIELTLKELTDAEKIIWWRKRSKLPQIIDAIVIRDVHFEGNKEAWGKVNELLLNNFKPMPKVFLNSLRKKTEKDLKEWSALFENIFFKSRDKMFLIHQLSFYFPIIKLKNHYEIETSTNQQIIEVGNPIHVKELSEAGLVLEYNRAIDLGEFRKFVLWRPDETEMPTFLAICNFSEENKSSKGVFANHFVFFGINDFYLKHLRLWLRANYIHQKEKE